MPQQPPQQQQVMFNPQQQFPMPGQMGGFVPGPGGPAGMNMMPGGAVPPGMLQNASMGPQMAPNGQGKSQIRTSFSSSRSRAQSFGRLSTGIMAVIVWLFADRLLLLTIRCARGAS